MIADSNIVATRAHEAADEGSDAPREAELKVLVEVGAQVVTIEPVEDLEGLSARQHRSRHLLFILRQQIGHARCHLALAVLNVELQRSGKARTHITAKAILHVQVQLLFVHIQHQRLRVERQVELVHQRSQAVNFIA